MSNTTEILKRQAEAREEREKDTFFDSLIVSVEGFSDSSEHEKGAIFDGFSPLQLLGIAAVVVACIVLAVVLL
jgi:hypothetical protein